MLLLLGLLSIYVGYMAKVLLSLPDEMLKKLDAFCKKNDFERSEFIRSLIRDMVIGINEILPPIKVKKLVDDNSDTDAHIGRVTKFPTSIYGMPNFTKEHEKENRVRNSNRMKKIDKLEKVLADKKIKLCKHGAMKGVCKKGCK